MTGGEFSGVDVDLLADYVGGALDGTERDDVARLVTEDPSWRAAHDELVAALVRVDAGLQLVARSAEPMPVDVAERLSLAISTAPAPVAPAPVATAPLTLLPGGAEDGLPATDGEDETPDGHPAVGRRFSRTGRRRWRPRAGAVAVAAAVVAFAGLGIAELADPATNSERAGSSAADAPVTTFQEPAGGQDAESGQKTTPDDNASRAWPRRVVATGNRYERATVAERAVSVAANTAALAGTFDGAADLPLRSDAAAGDLRRLNNSAAIRDCVAAIAAARAVPVARLEVVDFATFEGSPAVVVVFLDTAGDRWVWVSGPRCGVSRSDPDTRYQVPVG